MDFWIQKSSSKIILKLDFISKQPQSGIFNAAFPISPLCCAGCVGLSRTAAVPAVPLSWARGSCSTGAQRGRQVENIPPGSLQLLWRAKQQEPGEQMRRKCGMILESLVRNAYFSFFSLSFSKSPCFPPALLPGSVAAGRPLSSSYLWKGHSSLCPHCLSLKKTL